MRVDNTPEEVFTTEIDTAVKELDALKQRQTLGADSVQRYYQTYDTVNWDVTNYAIPAGAGISHFWRVTFTPDHPEQSSFATFFAYSSWFPVGTNQQLTWTEDLNYLTTPGRVMLVSFFNGSGEATTLQMDFTFNTGDTGTVTYVKL